MGPDGAAGVAEGQLRDGLERVLRAGPPRGGWALLVLYLSRLPEARPHHRRITAALLEDAAERYAGQLFALRNGDLALLFRPPDEGEAGLTLIGTLFAAETRQIGALRDLWPLPGAAGAARRYVGQLLMTPREPEPVQRGTGSPTADTLLRTAPLPVLLMRQTAVHLRSGQTPRILPLFREVGPGSRLVAAARPGAGDAGALRPDDLVARLEQRVLALARDALRAEDPAAAGLTVPLHLNLTPGGVMSEGFARLAAACLRLPALRVAVELPLQGAFSDPAPFILARERLRLTGMGFVLDHVSHAALRMSDPAALDPQWIKLDWDPGMADETEALRRAVVRLGPERVILAGCETEAAVVWGLGLGVHRFQGGFVDAMLGAERLRSCPVQRGCSLLQCQLRAATLFAADRAACLNHPLLDAGVAGLETRKP